MRKLAHVRSAGYGARTWSGARWYTPGPVQEIELLDVPSLTVPQRVTRFTTNGVFTPTPAPCRPARVASYRMTNPLVFQSYFRVHWEGLFGARANLEQGARRLPFRGSRLPMGKAEGQALIPYDPFPSAGELYPMLGGLRG